jgi:hypothetical protein
MRPKQHHAEHQRRRAAAEGRQQPTPRSCRWRRVPEDEGRRPRRLFRRAPLGLGDFLRLRQLPQILLHFHPLGVANGRRRLAHEVGDVAARLGDLRHIQDGPRRLGRRLRGSVAAGLLFRLLLLPTLLGLLEPVVVVARVHRLHFSAHAGTWGEVESAVVALALSALIGYAILNGITGARLLWLARRTGELPEAALGISYLCGGMLGWAFLLGGGTVAAQRPELARLGHLLQDVGLFCLSGGTLAAALFSWRVFAPNSRWQAALFYLLVAVLAADYIENVFITGAIFPPVSQLWYWPGAMARLGCFVWMAVAALRYARLLRRRVPLGLADPIVANRVLLWGLAGLMALAAAVVACTASILDAWAAHGPPLFLATIGWGFVGALLGWLAFLPPKRYLDWVAGKAA